MNDKVETLTKKVTVDNEGNVTNEEVPIVVVPWKDVTPVITASKCSTKHGASCWQFKGGKRMLPNMPCPCGSGKKYKKCCLNKGE